MKKIIIILIFFTTSICKAQKISGKYVNISDNNGQVLSFDNNIFTDQTPGHMNDYYGAGSYDVKNGKLLLNYKKIPNQDTSSYITKLKEFRISKDSVTLVNVFVFDKDSISIVAMMVIKNKYDDYLSSFLTDEKGNGHAIIPNTDYVSFFEISMLGYYPVKLNLKQFRGKSLDLLVYLKPAKIYYIEDKNIVFQIKENSKESLILVDSKGKQIMYKRIN